MKHLLNFIIALAIILIFFTILKKNNIIEGHGGGRGFGGRGLGYGGRGFGYGGWGRRGWGYGGGYGGNGWGYNTVYYQPSDNLCYDSLGNLTFCLTPNLIRPYFYY